LPDGREVLMSSEAQDARLEALRAALDLLCTQFYDFTMASRVSGQPMSEEAYAMVRTMLTTLASMAYPDMEENSIMAAAVRCDCDPLFRSAVDGTAFEDINLEDIDFGSLPDVDPDIL